MIEERQVGIVQKLRPVHPGEVLEEEFLKPISLSQHKLAISIGAPPTRISKIVRGERSITADTALRLARYFGTSAKFWLALQTSYDLDVAADELGDRPDREVHCRAPAVAEG